MSYTTKIDYFLDEYVVYFHFSFYNFIYSRLQSIEKLLFLFLQVYVLKLKLIVYSVTLFKFRTVIRLRHILKKYQKNYI